MVQILKGLDCADLALSGVSTRFVRLEDYEAVVRVIQRDHADELSAAGLDKCICVYCAAADTGAEAPLLCVCGLMAPAPGVPCAGCSEIDTQGEPK